MKGALLGCLLRVCSVACVLGGVCVWWRACLLLLLLFFDVVFFCLLLSCTFGCRVLCAGVWYLGVLLVCACMCLCLCACVCLVHSVRVYISACSVVVVVPSWASRCAG